MAYVQPTKNGTPFAWAQTTAEDDRATKICLD